MKLTFHKGENMELSRKELEIIKRWWETYEGEGYGDEEDYKLSNKLFEHAGVGYKLRDEIR